MHHPVKTGTLLYSSDFSLMCARNRAEQECCRLEPLDQRIREMVGISGLGALSRYPDGSGVIEKRALECG